MTVLAAVGGSSVAGEERVTFADFVVGRGQALQRTAFLLTGDWALAEDLVQTALARAYPRWDRIARDNPEAYVRRVLVNTWSSWWRRRWRGEVPTDEMPERAVQDEYARADRRSAVHDALSRLPRRQRAIVVLRYHEDMTEPQVAHALGISVGTVKSQTSKALTKLRGDAALTGYGASVATGGE
ncbi:MAG TPA: SigE family RNA polymerase sigma factor [Mycobacteriales bacterium]|nr:SigE family RNA polymerase sigma factor [Mycobacteriales bacterium]